MSSRSHPLFGRTLLRRAAIVAVVPALGLAMSILPVATPAAQALSCPDNTLCAWQNSDYSGTQWRLGEISREPGYWWYVGAAANDKISSLWNNSREGQYAYVAKDCPAGSEWTWIDRQGKNSNLANAKWPNGTSMNDSISAYAIGVAGKRSPSFPAHGSRIDGGC
jgi:Peptidase inhibitor family I36